MILNYSEFLFESKKHDIVEKAKKLLQHEDLRQTLQDCVDGKREKIQVVPTEGAKSYVAVAINSGGFPISEVFHTSDPKLALLCILLMNDGMEKTADELISIMNIRDSLLQYSVFPGERKMTTEEILAKYNVSPDDKSSYIASAVGSPIVRVF